MGRCTLCIVSGLHDDYNNPLDSPAFKGAPPEKAQKSDAISGAAVAVVRALSDFKEKVSETSSDAVGLGVSPNKATDLRMKNFQQL